LNVDPQKKQKFKINIRVPGWYVDRMVPGDLYKTVDNQIPVVPTPMVNGVAASYKIENGYVVIEREWEKSDVVTFDFPMEVKEIKVRPDVQYDSKRMAVQRGPILYCIEGADNKEGVWNVILPDQTNFTATNYKILDEPVIALQAEVQSAFPNANGNAVDVRKRKITAIPYYCWANRGANAMQVWLPTAITDVKINYQSKYPDGGNY